MFLKVKCGGRFVFGFCFLVLFFFSRIFYLCCLVTVWLLQCRTLLPSKSESVGFTTEDGLLRGLVGLFSWAWVLRVFSWEGFGEMVFISWGQRVLQRPLSSVRSLFCHRLQLTPALSQTQWLSWLGPGREGRTARGQSWRCLWTLPDLQSGIRQGAKQRHLRGLSRFFGCSLSCLYSVDSQQTSASTSCKGLCFPWYCFSHSKNPCALSSPNLLLGNVQLHRHCLKETDSLTTHIIRPALGWCSLGYRKLLRWAPVLLMMKQIEFLSCLFRTCRRRCWSP